MTTTNAQTEVGLAGFDDYLRTTMETWQVPGLAVGIVKDGEVIFLEGFGQRDIAQNLPITPHTIFSLASGTKAFTTMAVGLLVDEGRLDWDTPVRHYLPSFKLHDPVVAERLTPRDLVTHRSGLPRHDLAWYNAERERADLVRRLEYLEPNKDFRTMWQYQNLMYMATGYLIEYLTGQTWEEFVQQRIFQPLGMHESYFTVEMSQAAPDHALPYKKKDEALEVQRFYNSWAIAPAGSITTSVHDMCKWLRLHLAKGTYPGGRLIAEGLVTDMHTPQTVIQRPSKWTELPHISYGLGWFVEPYRGHDFIHHGGNIDGFSTMTTLMPQHNLGVVVLANLNATPAPWIVCLNAYERLLKLDQTPWTERYKQDEAAFKAGDAQGKEKSASDRIPDTTPSHALESYVGEYEHPGYGLFEWTLTDGVLAAKLNDNLLPVTHYHYDTFELEWKQGDSHYKATFATNARGDIESVTVPFEPTIRPIVFTRVPPRSMTNRNFLVQFTGDYEIVGFPMSITLKNGIALQVRLPGQPDYELVPRQGTEFTLKDLAAYSIEFVKDDTGNVSEAIVTQPSGVFTAKKR